MSDSEGESGSQIAAAAPKTFKELGLADPLCDACQKMNFKAPTAIQCECWPKGYRVCCKRRHHTFHVRRHIRAPRCARTPGCAT